MHSVCGWFPDVSWFEFWLRSCCVEFACSSHFCASFLYTLAFALRPVGGKYFKQVKSKLTTSKPDYATSHPMTAWLQPCCKSIQDVMFKLMEFRGIFAVHFCHWRKDLLFQRLCKENLKKTHFQGIVLVATKHTVPLWNNSHTLISKVAL